MPRRVLTDNGTQFKGAKFARCCVEFGIEHQPSSAVVVGLGLTVYLKSGNVYLMNEADYVTSKSTTVVVGLGLTVSDGCFLEEVLQLRDFVLSHQGGAMGRRRSRCSDAFCPRVIPGVLVGRWVGDDGIARRSFSHEARNEKCHSE
jgi:hypothetical protein